MYWCVNKLCIVCLQQLKEAGQSRGEENVPVNMVHKKINLADEMLAWEHERFSIKRMLAFTLSHLPSHKVPERTTILDGRLASLSISIVIMVNSFNSMYKKISGEVRTFYLIFLSTCIISQLFYIVAAGFLNC